MHKPVDHWAHTHTQPLAGDQSIHLCLVIGCCALKLMHLFRLVHFVITLASLYHAINAGRYMRVLCVVTVLNASSSSSSFYRPIKLSQHKKSIYLFERFLCNFWFVANFRFMFFCIARKTKKKNSMCDPHRHRISIIFTSSLHHLLQHFCHCLPHSLHVEPVELACVCVTTKMWRSHVDHTLETLKDFEDTLSLQFQ